MSLLSGHEITMLKRILTLYIQKRTTFLTTGKLYVSLISIFCNLIEYHSLSLFDISIESLKIKKVEVKVIPEHEEKSLRRYFTNI